MRASLASIPARSRPYRNICSHDLAEPIADGYGRLSCSESGYSIGRIVSVTKLGVTPGFFESNSGGPSSGPGGVS